MNTVWIVTYIDNGDEPVVTPFDNKKAAYKCYEYMLGEHDYVGLDACSVFSSFTVNDGR